MMVKFCTSCGFRSDLCHCNSGNCRKLTNLLKYDIAKSTSIQMGSQGPPGPPGPGSALFFTQQGLVTIPPNASNFPIIGVEVTTTENNQRIKLDATINTNIEVEEDATEFAYSLAFSLVLIPNVFISETVVRGCYNRPNIVTARTYTEHPNFTVVDVPGPAGTYMYQVFVTEGLRENISMIQSFNIGLTAQVFLPTNP